MPQKSIQMQNFISQKIIQWAKLKSPLGEMIAAFSEHKLCYLSFGSESFLKTWAKKSGYCLEKIVDLPLEFQREMSDYWTGKRIKFRFPVTFLQGTAFQKKIWSILATIHYGETQSYAWVARQAGSPKACRAVGQANGKNPICLVIPCHRVIASDKSLGGYSGGISLKKKLLAHESS